jgi:hypothetical protein
MSDNQLNEPVAWRDRTSGTLLHEEWLDADPLYIKPQPAERKCTWVGLTDEDKLHIEIMGGKSDVMLAEMVEAKLKEKNGA